MKTRDMSTAEFQRACERRGFTPTGFMGYYKIGHGVEVSVHNAGLRKRDRLAYLIRQAERVERESRVNSQTDV